MAWHARYAEILARERPLAPLTTMGVGGPARYLFLPESTTQLAGLLADLNERQIPVHLLGNGSNLLVDDAGVDGAVVCLRRMRFVSRVAGQPGELEVGAGVLLSHLLGRTIRMGLAGLERCVGIPGAVGGSVVQNAGGADGAIGDLLVSATLVTPEGKVECRGVRELGLGYRRSRLGGAAIAAVRLRLKPAPPREIARRARRAMARRKASQPLRDRSSGCIFVNPAGGRSAGRLLDRAGMKGQRRGRASYSEKHANFIVNRGGASSRDILDLVREGRDRVFERSGISLSLEVAVWPRRSIELD